MILSLSSSSNWIAPDSYLPQYSHRACYISGVTDTVCCLNVQCAHWLNGKMTSYRCDCQEIIWPTDLTDCQIMMLTRNRILAFLLYSPKLLRMLNILHSKNISLYDSLEHWNKCRCTFPIEKDNFVEHLTEHSLNHWIKTRYIGRVYRVPADTRRSWWH